MRNLKSPLYCTNWLLFLLFLPLSSGATSTEFCNFHAAYFDAEFVNNYGSMEEHGFLEDICVVTNVIVRLDSLLRSRQRDGRLEHFVRWRLIDSYMKGFQHDPGSYVIEGRNVFLRFDDSLAINKALNRLWCINDFALSPNKHAGAWLFSLHVGVHNKFPGPEIPIRDIFKSERPDSDLLWLKIEGDWWSSHHFYQHEIDGYYHTYTGLYLTRDNVLQAKQLLEAKGLKTTVTSHYLTHTILRHYAHQ
jgi:hypothetical protein